MHVRMVHVNVLHVPRLWCVKRISVQAGAEGAHATEGVGQLNRVWEREMGCCGPHRPLQHNQQIREMQGEG